MKATTTQQTMICPEKASLAMILWERLLHVSGPEAGRTSNRTRGYSLQGVLMFVPEAMHYLIDVVVLSHEESPRKSTRKRRSALFDVDDCFSSEIDDDCRQRRGHRGRG